MHLGSRCYTNRTLLFLRQVLVETRGWLCRRSVTWMPSDMLTQPQDPRCTSFPMRTTISRTRAPGERCLSMWFPSSADPRKSPVVSHPRLLLNSPTVISSANLPPHTLQAATTVSTDPRPNSWSYSGVGEHKSVAHKPGCAQTAAPTEACTC